MNKIKITIIGNSVPLRVRPNQSYPDNKTYANYLEEYLMQKYPNKEIDVINRSIGSTTIYNALNKLDEFINTSPNFFIINHGVVEASTRDIPMWFHRFINTKKENLLLFILRGFYQHFIAKYRSFFVRIRGKKSWMSLNKFEKYFIKALEILEKDTNAKIIVVPINPANERIEKELPGSFKSYLKFNQVMSQLTKDYSQSIINIDDLDLNIHCPDGIHYSKQGHELIALKLLNKINSII